VMKKLFSSLSSQKNSYRPLTNSTSTSDVDSDEYEEKEDVPPSLTSSTHIPLIALFIVLFINMTLFTYYVFSPGRLPYNERNFNAAEFQRNPAKPLIWNGAGQKPLERPSQFIGLDKLERPTPPIHKESVNFPNVLGRVDSSDPSKVITYGPLSRRFGLDGFEARRAEISKTVSTVLQFRMIDFGMEECTLHVKLPSSSPISRANQIRIYSLPNHTKSSIDISSLSYSSIEGRFGEEIGILDAGKRIDWSHKFHCPSDSLHSFALVASTDSTVVEWWQDKQSLDSAVYIVQHATV